MPLSTAVATSIIGYGFYEIGEYKRQQFRLESENNEAAKNRSHEIEMKQKEIEMKKLTPWWRR